MKFSNGPRISSTLHEA